MSEQQLVTLERADAMAVFTTEGKIDPILADVRKKIDAFVPDISTARGRKEVASMAHKVAQSKTYLETVGKELADEVKAIPKKIDASRKKIRDTLDAWRDEVRQPLTQWEEAEEARVKKHLDVIESITLSAMTSSDMTSEEIRERLSKVESVKLGPHCEEYEATYARAKDAALADLRIALVRREKYEAEQTELARLRAAEAERVAKEREETIRREAAERAKREAEETAQAEARRVEAAAKAEREAAERRELELKLQAEAAERRALETEQRLKREAEAKRQEEALEAQKREADQKHRAGINRAAVKAMVDGGIAEETAKAVVTLIAKKAVPNITIYY